MVLDTHLNASINFNGMCCKAATIYDNSWFILISNESSTLYHIRQYNYFVFFFSLSGNSPQVDGITQKMSAGEPTMCRHVQRSILI